MINLSDDAPRASVAEEELQSHLEARQRELAVHSRRTRELARRRRRARIRRNRVITGTLLAGLGGLLWATLGTADASPQGRAPKVKQKFTLDSHVDAVRRIPGHLGVLPWPTKGEGAVAVLGGGLMASSPSTGIVPIASLTKMMTAYLVLHDHPIAEGAEGPTFTMTASDVAGYVHADQTDESNVVVQLGEHLTEQQLLEALLIPSADNIADLLATWDAGSIPAFVQKMNRTAASLGLAHTHYADASGVNPGSRSDASDQAVLAAQLMQSPVVRGIVSKSHLPFPVAGTIWNYNPGLGVDGIIGVKSGFTSEAQGCLATAAYRTAGGQHVLVVAVSLGQAGGLGEAAQMDEGLLTSAGQMLVAYRPPVPAGLGNVVANGSSTPVSLAGQMPVVVGWPGLKIREQVQAATVPASSSASTSVGQLVVSSPSGVLGRVSLVAANSTSPSGASSGSTGVLDATN